MHLTVGKMAAFRGGTREESAPRIMRHHNGQEPVKRTSPSPFVPFLLDDCVACPSSALWYLRVLFVVFFDLRFVGL